MQRRHWFGLLLQRLSQHLRQGDHAIARALALACNDPRLLEAEVALNRPGIPGDSNS